MVQRWMFALAHSITGNNRFYLSPEPEAGDPVRARFRIFNADGSEAEISGNGLRCAGAFLVSSGAAPSPRIVFGTAAGDRLCEVLASRGRLFEVRIGLGSPRLASKAPSTTAGRATGSSTFPSRSTSTPTK